MPSVSKAQQRAAGMAYAAKKGKIPMSKLKGAAKEMAKMPADSLKDYAKTKSKDLPDKKEDEDMDKEAMRSCSAYKGYMNKVAEAPVAEKALAEDLPLTTGGALTGAAIGGGIGGAIGGVAGDSRKAALKGILIGALAGGGLGAAAGGYAKGYLKGASGSTEPQVAAK